MHTDSKKHDTSTDANNVLADDAVMPRLFFVVARTSEEGWQQLSVGLPTYERAVAFRDEPFTKKDTRMLLLSVL